MKTKSRIGRLTLALAFATLVGSGCGDESTEPRNEPPEIEGQIIDVSYPLAVGNQWTYDQVESSRLASATTETSTIVDTHTYFGEVYARQYDTGNSLSDTTYVRQEGKALYLVLASYLQPNTETHPMYHWVHDVIPESFPWKIADFRMPLGLTWRVASREGIVRIDDVIHDTKLEVTAQSLGALPIVTPGGSWDLAYRGRIEHQVTMSGHPAYLGIQEIALVDSVGLVWMNTETTESIPGEPTTESESTRELTAYQVQNREAEER